MSHFERVLGPTPSGEPHTPADADNLKPSPIPSNAPNVETRHTSAAAVLMVADLPTVVNNATGWRVGILAVLATFFLTLGGVRYMTAGGDPSEVERAKGSLRSAGIGYALALLAPVLLTVLKHILGV